MDSDIHRLLTRTLNPVISSLYKAREKEGTPRFRAESYGGTISYSRKGGQDLKLTKWLDGVKNQLQNEYSDGPLDDALNSLKTAYEETFRYALLTGNDKAGEILTDKAEEIDEKYSIGLRDKLNEIADTDEIEITTDLNVSAPDVDITVRTTGRTPYTVAAFKGEKTLQLPAGTYEIIAKHEGVRDRTTIASGETTTAELGLREKLRAKQQQEAEKRKKEREKSEKKEKSKNKEQSRPVKNEESDKVPVETSKSKDQGKNSSSLIDSLNSFLLPFRKLKRAINRGSHRTWRFIKYTARRTYKFVKATVLVLIVGLILLASISPSARTHMLNGNPEGIVHDVTGIAQKTAAFVSEANVSKSLSSNDFNAEKTERAIHRRINTIRRNNGLNTLEYDQELSSIARKHSQDMASREVVSHTSRDGDSFQDRYREAGYDCNIRTRSMIYHGGENIAKTYYETAIEGGIYHSNEEQVAEGIVRQWMDSPEHRENILRDYWRQEGIGIIKTTDDSIYATQNFC